VSCNIQERYTFDALGKRNVFDTNFTVKTGTTFDWNRAFTGQVLDMETGLMLYRERYYSTELGRFVSRDNIIYNDGYNSYLYVANDPTTYLDPYGDKSILDLVVNNFKNLSTSGNVSGNNNEVCVSGTSSVLSIPIPAVPGLFVNLDITYSGCYKKCCPTRKCCDESDYDNYIALSFGAEFYGKYGVGLEMKKRKANQKERNPYDPWGGETKQKKRDRDLPGRGRISGGAGGQAGGIGSCPKKGLQSVSGYGFIRGCAGAGFGACFDINRDLTKSLDGLKGSAGFQWGVYGAWGEAGGGVNGTYVL
ncbi:MAG: RHS repeat-associated core domain-containing protein, partial [Planctomycetaceae bacterium]|nr:RHS repeat-associated core domain-containing protein [Planctomycetaceae bacterium]